MKKLLILSIILLSLNVAGQKIETQIQGLSVFPNPVKNGVFYINTDANAERTVTVFDVLGKQVLNTTTSESAINVSNLTAGVYMVQISEEGNTATKKLVIQENLEKSDKNGTKQYKRI